ncbi:MAG: hypothetical protein HC896_13635 [Bacteroidales bacterium]|nr:hypothetical protein [Bacteroidales bacterium]
MIKHALIFNFRVKEFLQFIANVLMIVEKHVAAKLNLQKVHGELEAVHLKLEAFYKEEKKSDISAALSLLDARRDEAQKCIFGVADSFKFHSNEEKRNAARLILETINKYGQRLYALNYAAETAVLKNLSKDFNEPGCDAALKLLGIDDSRDEMQEANTAFARLFVERLQEISEKTEDTISGLRQNATQAYELLVKHANAHAILEPSEHHTKFINHFNENIDHFNAIVEQRKKARETAPGDEDEGGSQQ